MLNYFSRDKHMLGLSEAGGLAHAPQFLANQLTLYQPGGHIIPTQYYAPPLCVEIGFYVDIS